MRASETLLATIGSFFGAQLAAGIILLIVGLGLGLSGIPENQITQSPFWQFAAISLTAGLSFLFIRWILRRRNIPFKDIGVTKLQAQHVMYAVLGFMAYFGFYMVVLGLLSQFAPGIDVEQEQEIGFDTTQAGVGLIIVFISLVVIPPLWEEFVMRGFLFSGLRWSLDFVQATIITSTLFAIAHLPGGKDGLLWIGAVDTFILSLVMCTVREKTGSIWPAVGVHALKNGLAFTVLFVFPEIIG